MELKHIVCYSKGHSSGLVAIEVARKYGTKNMILVNHDINPDKEEEDTKRFGIEVANYLGLEITYANYGGITNPNELPDQFDVCIDKKGFKVPNTSDAFCTFKLKTEPFYKYLQLNHADQNCIIYYGYDPKEIARKNKKISVMGLSGWNVEFPLMDWDCTIKSTKEIGIEPPIQYSTYKHANCAGCLKAGIQHWYVTYCSRPDVYAKASQTESKLGYTILRKSIQGKLIPFSLEQFGAIFSEMRAAGIPATEHYPPQRFKKALKIHGVDEMKKHMPCDCAV